MSRTTPSGFTLTEVVVALLIAATAALALATTVLAERRLRIIADAEREGARGAREHLEFFTATRCGADSSGAARAAWGDSWWSATAVPDGWILRDSVRPLRAARAVGVTAVAACAP